MLGCKANRLVFLARLPHKTKHAIFGSRRPPPRGFELKPLTRSIHGPSRVYSVSRACVLTYAAVCTCRAAVERVNPPRCLPVCDDSGPPPVCAPSLVAHCLSILVNILGKMARRTLVAMAFPTIMPSCRSDTPSRRATAR